MSKAFIRLVKKQDRVDDVQGLLVTALKETAHPRGYGFESGTIGPEDYRYYYQPEDFYKMDIVLENRFGYKANLNELKYLLPYETFGNGGLDWVLVAAVFTAKRIEICHAGFDKFHVLAESKRFLLTERKPSYAQTKCIGVCGAEVRAGDKLYKVRFDVDGGNINGLPSEYADISTVASEYRNGVLTRDFYVPAGAPIIVHHYFPLEGS